MKSTDVIEPNGLRASTGLFYYHGLHNLKFQNLDTLFSKSDGSPISSATMSDYQVFIVESMFQWFRNYEWKLEAW